MTAADDGRRADLKDGGGRRKDYGAAGCAGVIYRFAVITMLLLTLRGGRR